MACPPLWFILLDGSTTNPRYWQTMSRILLQSMEDIPDHVHVALILASSSDTNQAVCSIFQCTSPIPHLLHYTAPDETNADDDEQRLNLLQALLQSVTNGMHRSHLLTAIRSLMDYGPRLYDEHELYSSHQQQQPPSPDRHYHNNGNHHNHYHTQNNNSCSNTTGMPLTWCVEAILDALQRGGHAAGQRMNGGDSTNNNRSRLPYAGAKLTCFLAQQPSLREASKAETATSPSHSYRIPIIIHDLSSAQQQQQQQYTPCIGKGGFAGKIVDTDGQRFGRMHGSNEFHLTADESLTPKRLQEQYPSTADTTVYMDELGRECAKAAMGVDLLFVLDPEQHTDADSNMLYEEMHNGAMQSGHLISLALPLYGHLSTRSGAPGPVLFDMSNPVSLERLEREVRARAPWQASMVFGAELRVRLPPGFVVDTAKVEPTEENGPQLATLYSDAGLMGPASAVEESNQLWRMGTCDAFTAFTVDATTLHESVPIEQFVSELEATVAMKPVIQTCFAYTTIERDDNGMFFVKRQMKIHSCSVPVAKTVEELYNSLDLEVLSTVLFHKLAIASLQDGITESLSIAQDWLVSTLVSAYQSAEDYHEDMMNDNQQSTLTTNAADATATEFLAHERLLDLDGELSPDDILLAQGHYILKDVALMIYQLMQCDAFRSSRPSFCPSSDLRYATLCQMLSMTPHSVSRCIAPMLQAWLSGADETEPVVDCVDLRHKSVKMAAEEYSNYDDVVFFVDSPDEILLLDGRNIDSESTKESSTSSGVTISESLRNTMERASHSYRVKPDMSSIVVGNSTHTSLRTLSNIFVRDAPSPSGLPNYTKWKKDIARRVLE